MPSKKNKTSFNQILQEQTSSLSPIMTSSNNNNNNDNISSSLSSTTIRSICLSNEILRDQNKMLREENKLLHSEIEYLKKNWMPKPTGEAALYFVKASEMILNESNENQSNGQKEMEEEKIEKEEGKRQQLKTEKTGKKKEIKRIGKILGLTFNELINCKQTRITTTCRKIIKMMYPNIESRANQRISTISSKTIRAIRYCAKLMHPKQKHTPDYVLNNAIGNVFSVARQ